MSNTAEGHSGTSRLRKVVAGSLLLNVAANAFLYVGQLLIARRLSREDYAIFTVAVSFISLFALFADLGLTLFFVRTFAEAEEEVRNGKPDRRGELLGSIVVFRMLLAAIVAVAIVIAAPLLGYNAITVHTMYLMLPILFISSRLMVVRAVGEAFLRGHNRYQSVVLYTVIDAVVFAGALYWYHSGALDLDGAVIIYSLCHIPGFLLLTGSVVRMMQSLKLKLRASISIIKKMLEGGLPLILSTAFLTIHNYADALLLDKLSTPQEVSAFGAGLRILTAIIFLPTVFSAVLGPLVTQAIVRNDHARIKTVVGTSMRLISLTAFIIALSLTGAPAVAIRVLFGSDKYLDAAPIITLFGWTFLPIAIATFLGEIAIAEGKLWISTMYMGTIMVVSVVTDLLLIPSMGAIGAAWAKCAAVSIGAVLLLIISRQMHVFDEKKFFLFLSKSILSVGSALLILRLAGPYLHVPELVLTIIAVAIFAIVAVVTKAVDIQELKSLLGTAPAKGQEG